GQRDGDDPLRLLRERRLPADRGDLDHHGRRDDRGRAGRDPARRLPGLQEAVSTREVLTANAPAFLPVYFGTPGERPLGVLPMLAPGFTFSFLWSDDRGPREFAGGLEDFDGYMAQREPDGQRHHIDVGVRDEQREVVLGHTTRYGERLGTFTFA